MYFLKTQINKKRTLIFFSYLHRMFIEYLEEYTLSNFGGLDFLQSAHTRQESVAAHHMDVVASTSINLYVRIDRLVA